MDVRMDGRTALITGSSLGLGLAMGHRFAESGANVALVGRRADVVNEAVEAVRKTAGGNGGKVAGFAYDVSTAEGTKSLHADVVKALGPVDILVNNAGTSRTGKFDDITDEVWQEDLDLKLFGAIRLCRLVMPGMRERKWGRIINVLNLGAKAPRAGGAPTAVSRAAGMALTKILSGEGAPHNILVNGLLVGNIQSDQWVQRHKTDNSGKTLDEYYAELGKRIPLGRLGTAEEFANMACFLASEQGSYITGVAINVDGGMSPVV
jgi:3-oxoacyl-[acyl-carrier protein] reductase